MEQAPKSSISEKKKIEISVNLQMSGEMNIFQNDYLYWDKAKYKIKGDNKHDTWAAIKFHRSINRRIIRFGKYWFSYPNTDFLQRALHTFDLYAGGTLTSNIGIAETDKNKFIISSLIEESINSSQMEGANTTRKKAKEMLQKEKKPQTKSEQMILNNFITMKHIVNIKDEDLSVEKLLEIHRMISNKTLEFSEEGGVFRKNDDIFVGNIMAGEIVHQPPPREELENLMKDLILFFNSDTEEFIHPIVKACIIHFMIGWIHPFTDGNGRTARALFYWYMLKKGYWLTEFLSISKIIKETKNQYEKAFLYTENDDSDLGYFITYQVKTLLKAYDNLKLYILKKQKEVIQAASFMKIEGVNDRMAQIIKLIYDDGDRVLTNKEIAIRFNVSLITARSDLKNLVNMGFLQEIKVNKQKINYIKTGIFDNIINNLIKQ